MTEYSPMTTEDRRQVRELIALDAVLVCVAEDAQARLAKLPESEVTDRLVELQIRASESARRRVEESIGALKEAGCLPPDWAGGEAAGVTRFRAEVGALARYLVDHVDDIADDTARADAVRDWERAFLHEPEFDDLD